MDDLFLYYHDTSTYFMSTVLGELIRMMISIVGVKGLRTIRKVIGRVGLS